MKGNETSGLLYAGNSCLLTSTLNQYNYRAAAASGRGVVPRRMLVKCGLAECILYFYGLSMKSNAKS